MESDQVQRDLIWNLCDKCTIWSNYKNSEQPPRWRVSICTCLITAIILNHTSMILIFTINLLFKLKNPYMFPINRNKKRKAILLPCIIWKNHRLLISYSSKKSVVNAITVDDQYPNFISRVCQKETWWK